MTSRSYITGVAILVSVVTLMAADIFLPSLPTMATYFGKGQEQVSLAIPLYLFGSFISALILGILSDHFGRKPIMLAGLALFVGGTALAALSTSLPVFLTARFLQGLGATVSPVVGWAIIQDVYSGDASAKAIAWMGSIVSLAPMVAPALGGMIHVIFGWRGNFYFILGLGLVSLGLLLQMKDTANLEGSKEAFSLKRTFETYRRILTDRRFLTFVFLFALLQCGVWSFLTVIPFYYENKLGLSPNIFGFYLSGSAFFFILGAFCTPWILARTTVAKTLLVGLSVALAGSVLLLCTHIFVPTLPFVIALVISTYSFGSAIVWGPSTSRALQCFDESRGAASGVRTLILMGAFSLGGFIGSLLDTNSLLPISMLLITIAITGQFMLRFLVKTEASLQKNKAEF